MILHSTVPGAYAGSTVLNYLSRRFTYQGSESWLRHILEGRITLNGTRCDPGTVITQGDVTGFEPPEFTEPPADCTYRVIHEDDFLLGIDKPGNLLVHRAGKSFCSNLIHLVRRDRPDLPFAGVVNRLDRETSGVVLIAKTREVLAALNASFAAGRVSKRYEAIVSGFLPRNEMVVDVPVGPDRDSGLGYRHTVSPEGKPAVTRLRCIRTVGGMHSYIEARPQTGRTHQIRLHCRFVGCPVVGDRLYGSDSRTPDFPRHALHCAELCFVHPVTDETVSITAEIPQDLRRYLQILD